MIRHSLVVFALAFSTIGCHPIPQVHSEREAVRGSSAEERGILRRWNGEMSQISEPERNRRSDAIPPGHIRPVGFTQKNFNDMAKSDSTLPPTVGNVEWNDETISQIQNLEVLSESPITEKTVTDPDISVFLDELPDFDRPVEPRSLTKPRATVLADSIESARDFDTADISFLPETKESTSAPSVEGMTEDWRVLTRQAIALLQKEIDRRVSNGEICAAQEARLRLLLLTTGNIPGAAEKIAGMDPNLQIFWQKECSGLGRFIEMQEMRPSSSLNTSWMETVPDFQEGVSALKAGMPLSIRKSLFVKEPSVFGYYEEISPFFKPGETVNVYFELDNVVCRKSNSPSGGCEIEVLCRRELTDSLDRRVVETREKLCTGHSASPLNDIALNLSVCLPEGLPAGTYKLKTAFLDRNSVRPQPVTQIMNIRID